jgi:hypothetical protein
MSEISNSEKAGRVGTAVVAGVGTLLGANACVYEPETTPTPIVQQVNEDDDLFKKEADPSYKLLEEEQTPENFTIDLGKYGTLKSEYNPSTGMYHMAFSTEAMEKLKAEGGEIDFTLPFQIIVNMSGGNLFVQNENGEYEEWNLGNPAEKKDGEFVIEEGRSFKGTWEAGNDSAALEIILSPTGSFDDFKYSPIVEHDNQTEAEKAGLAPLDLQELGTYLWREVYDEDGELVEYILEIAEKNQIEEGTKNLADLKRDGGLAKFSIPFEIKALNSITGTIFYINPETGDVTFLNTGNPVTDHNGKSEIEADSMVFIYYLPGNNNGFSLHVSADEVNGE